MLLVPISDPVSNNTRTFVVELLGRRTKPFSQTVQVLSFCTADPPEIHNWSMMIDLNIPDMGIFPPDFSDTDQVKLVSKGENNVSNSLYRQLQNFFSWSIDMFFPELSDFVLKKWSDLLLCDTPFLQHVRKVGSFLRWKLSSLHQRAEPAEPQSNDSCSWHFKWPVVILLMK